MPTNGFFAMKLTHITLDQLKVSPLNVRKKGGKDVADLVTSIRSLGLLDRLRQQGV